MKTVICDMDDTLCESCRPISFDMAEVITKLVNKGFTFVVIGGSDLHHIKEQVCDQLKVPIFVLANSGSKMYKWTGAGLEFLHQVRFTSAKKAKVFCALDNLRRKYSLIPETSYDDQVQDRGTQITISILGRHADFKHKAAYDPDKVKRKRFVEFLARRLKGFSLTIGGTSSIDITPASVTKGTCLRNFINKQGINKKDCLFLGDGLFPGGNDWSVKGVVSAFKVDGVGHTLKFLNRLDSGDVVGLSGLDMGGVWYPL